MAVRIVTRVTRHVYVSAGSVCDLGYRAVWCARYRRQVLAGRPGGRCEELIRANASGRGWPVVALEIMSGHVHLFVNAHRTGSPSPTANQFTGLTSRRLRAGIPQLRSRRSALWSRSYCAAASAVSAQTVCWPADTQDERPWQKGRAR